MIFDLIVCGAVKTQRQSARYYIIVSSGYAVEMFLRVQGDNILFLYDELPFDLLGMLFEKMRSAEITQVIAACTWTGPSAKQRWTDFRTVERSL